MVPDGMAHVVASRQFSFVNNIFTYGSALQATIGGIFCRSPFAGATGQGEELRMQDACLVFVGSINPEARRPRRLRLQRGNARSAKACQDQRRKQSDLPVGDAERVAHLCHSEIFIWREGTVSAHRFERATNSLTYINKQPALGSIAAHNHHPRRHKTSGGRLCVRIVRDPR
jgi:hypothetical protein